MHPTTPRNASLSPASRSREETFHMDDERDDGDDLVLPAEHGPGGSDLDERVQTTQNRLAQLRQEAETLEAEKQQFEELSRQQKEFMHGRVEVGEKLTRALSHLDKETYEAQRRVEQLLVIKDSFNHQLDVIDSLNPEQWDPEDLRHDLGRSLALISEAREEYVKGSSRIHLLTGGAAAAGTPSPGGKAATLAAHGAAPTVTGPGSLPLALNRATFRFWLFCGLGFTVPLALTALLIFCAWLIFR